MRRLHLWHSALLPENKVAISLPTIIQVSNFKNYCQPNETSTGKTTLYDIKTFGEANSYG